MEEKLDKEVETVWTFYVLNRLQGTLMRFFFHKMLTYCLIGILAMSFIICPNSMKFVKK